MAEIAISAALVLVELVSPFLEQLYSDKNGRNLKSEVGRMQGWLSYMKAFMEDNYGREGSNMMQVLIGKVRDIAYDIEDVLDELVLHSPPYTFHRYRVTRKIHNAAHQLRHGFPLHGISDKIGRITRAIEDIISQNEILRINSQASSSSSSRVMIRTTPSPRPLLLDDEMVGYQQPKAQIMSQLVDPQRKLLTVAVNGPCGSGKTTLVKNVFWKQGILGKFDCHAWISVSPNSDVEELLINMLRQLCGSRKDPYPSEDGSSTSAKLQNYLSGKKYIVALVDVWRDQDWDHIRNALPDAFSGSRIIVTTSSSDLARRCASTDQHVHILDQLDWLHAWTLFCRKAFPDTKGECPLDLKDSSVAIVTKCEGLPLAIVAVAGALAKTPKLPNEWNRFHHNFGGEIRSDSDSKLAVISNALLPSYLDLHTKLKSCFLYFSIFPEDYSVERGRLVRLWVAELFAKDTDYKTAEEVAEEYLNELIQRNLVHVSKWDFDGRPKNCRVLNVIHNFIIQKCKDENFASLFPRGNTNQRQKIRRLSIHNNCNHLPQNSDLCGVRSMFLLRLIHEPVSSELKKQLRKLKLVRALDFQGAPLMKFPKDITRLTLLKYLSFRDTKINTIPSSIKKLSYLETLDLKQTDVTELPPEISSLHNLRHLFVYKYNVVKYVDFDSVQGAEVHQGIGNLECLQDLSLVKVDKKGIILKDIGKKLTLLRKLGLTGLRREHGKDLWAAVTSMQCLTTMDLSSATREEFLDVEEMVNPPRTLQRVYLKGRLKRFPRWISSLHNLLRIGLKWCKLESSPLQALGELPNLMELQLVDCFIGGELSFESGSFKKLRILLIEDLVTLHTILIRGGAMAELKKVSIRRCPEMRMLLLGSPALEKVEELSLYDVAEETVAKLRNNGEDRDRVKHIPLIHSFKLNNNIWSFENLSHFFSN